MRYIPLTQEDKNAMLNKIGVRNIDELFTQIPEEFRPKKPLKLPVPLSEMELTSLMETFAEEGVVASKRVSFYGDGINRHFVPAVIPSLLNREEWKTAYTPYQPEASQGTLQSQYEYQTCIALLTDMDVSNASLYDGATALAEAVLMARRINKKGKVAYVSSAVNPRYREVLKTYLRDVDIPIVELPFDEKTGKTIFREEQMKEALCVVVGYPNYFGIIEDLVEARAVATKTGALLISSTTEMLSLALLKPPGEFGVDIFTGEGQSFGIPPSFGGPLLGVMATKEAYVRSLPGRIIGRGYDKEGKEAYVLVIATREQHIRRKDATSNICTNEAACSLAAVMYLTLYGKEGLYRLARQNIEKADLLKRKLQENTGVVIPYSGRTFNEFVIRTDILGEELLRLIEYKNICGGVALSENYPECKNDVLISVTEMNTDDDIDSFVRALTEIMK